MEHTSHPPKCALPAPPADRACNVDDKHKLEQMPDSFIFCDVMRAAETPAGHASSHKPMHTQQHVNCPEQAATPPQHGVQRGGAFQTATGTAAHVAATAPQQNPNKSERQWFKALAQGSCRNIAEWGRRQGYHCKSIKNTKKRHVAGAAKAKHPGVARKPGVVRRLPGRAQEAMRNRGEQPLVGATCRTGSKAPIDLPEDADLFGC